MEDKNQDKNQDENREETIDQLFMSFENAETNNVLECEELPNYYYDFIMDDEDPVEAVEKSISETQNIDFMSRMEPRYESSIENLDDTFYNTLINNSIITRDIFNEQPDFPKEDDEIYESLNNYILNRGSNLKNTTERLLNNRNLNFAINRVKTAWKTENASEGAQNIFIMELLYNPKFTDDFVCGSFVDAIKTPLTLMYNCEEINSSTKHKFNHYASTGVIFLGAGHNVYVHNAPNPTNNKKLMNFSTFANTISSTINYNVVEVNDFVDFPILDPNLIYAIRFQRMLTPINLDIRDTKINHMEFIGCSKLISICISPVENYTPRMSAIFNDTPLVGVPITTLKSLFSPTLSNLFISFSGLKHNDKYRIHNIKNIEGLRVMTKWFNLSKSDIKEIEEKFWNKESDGIEKREIDSLTLYTISTCIGLKVLCLAGCLVTNEFILPPNLREFYAVCTKFAGKISLPSSLFSLHIIDCDCSEVLSDSLDYLPDTLYKIHIEDDNFCLTDFLKRRKKPLPCALQKIYCKCCDSITNLHIFDDNQSNNYSTNHITTIKMSSFAKLNSYCTGNLLQTAKYPALRYYLDMFYRDPTKQLYKDMHPSELYCCKGNIIDRKNGKLVSKRKSFPVEYMRDDLRIADIIKRINSGRVVLVWTLSFITVDTYDGKLPMDLVKYIAFIAYPYLGIDKYAKFNEYNSLLFNEDLMGYKYYENIESAEKNIYEDDNEEDYRNFALAVSE